MEFSKNHLGDNHYDESIFALAPFPMWIYDLESLQFLAVNKEAVQQYGYSEAEFLSMTLDKIRPVKDVPILNKTIEKARNRTELFKESIFRHQTKAGRIISVQLKGNLITYKGRKAELVTAIDLTERLQEQKILEKQKEYFETIEKTNDILLKSEDWLSALDDCFKIIGETLEIDRIYFFQNNLKKETASQRLEWSKQRIEPQIDNPKLQDLPFSDIPVFMKPLLSGKYFQTIVSEMPFSSTKKLLQDQDIKSILVAPVISNNSFMGFIGMDDCTTERKWTVEESQLIKSLTTNLAQLIARQNIQTELINNEYKFRTMVQKGSDLIAILNKEGVIQYVSHSSIEVIEIPPEEFIGCKINDFTHPEDVPKIEKCLKEILQKDVVSIPPFRIPDAKGNYKWMETKLTNLIDDPVISGILANTWDVTSEMERKIEKELLDSISKAIGQPASIKECLGEALSEFLNLSEICLAEIWIKSQDGSRLNLRAFRHNDSENLKTFYSTPSPVKSFYQGEGLPGNIWNNEKTISWGDISEYQIFLRKDAAKRTGLLSAIGIPITYNNEFLGCFILFSQQPKKKLADVEKLLKETGNKLGAVIKQKITEDEYRSFFEISPDPHCIIGFDGYLKKYNRSFTQLLGYEESTLLNKQIFSFVHEEDQAEALKNIESSLAEGISKSFTVRFITVDGETKWLIWSFTVIPEAKILLAVAKDITEQKIAEEDLKKTYNRLEKAQRIANLGYFTFDLDSEISEWSSETYEIFGVSPESFIPTWENVKMAYHPDDRYLLEPGANSNLDPGKIKRFELRVIKPSGEVRWVHQEVHLIIDEQNQPISIEGTIQDITDKKLAEQELKKTYNRLRKAQGIANLGYWAREFGSDLLEWSEETYKIFGYSPETFTPTIKNIALAFHPDDRHLTEENPVEGLSPGEVRRFEHRIKKASGEIRWLHQEVHFVADENGQPKSIEGTIQDITERKEKEEQLKISNERFLLAMKASNEMIWEIDHKKNIIIRGSGNEEVIEYRLSEPFNLKNSWFDKIYPDDLERVWNSFQQILSDPKKTFWREEYRILLPNGTFLYFIDRCYIYKDEMGNPIRSVGSILDVTVSKQQLEQIKLQNKNLREIAWQQSHIIRAPLARILGLTGLVKDYEDDEISYDEIFDMISDSAQELDQVIREIAQKTEVIEENDI